MFRRYKAGGHPEREALVMEHARRHGFPAPRVFGVRADGIELELVAGVDMVADAKRRPWRLRAHAQLLAGLHHRLHAIPAPPTLPRAGDGEALLHLDFHPLNVLLTTRGPVVIDWTNARAGDPALDAALTWVILATSSSRGGPASGPLALMVRLFLHWFLAGFDREALRRALPAAAARRLEDPNVGDDERAAVRRLVAEAGS